MSITIETMVALGTLFGAGCSAIMFALRTFYKSLSSDSNRQLDLLQKSVETIKKEVVRNGGGSIKDLVLKLDKTCERMEVVQRVIEQRSRAALHYQDRCLFETDRCGNLTWANEAFYQNTVECGDISSGMDWITIVSEDEREEFLKEFISCLNLGRRLDFEVRCHRGGRRLRFIGYPYRISEGVHEGFLIHINKRDD